MVPKATIGRKLQMSDNLFTAIGEWFGHFFEKLPCFRPFLCSISIVLVFVLVLENAVNNL